jgi:hypothetical protein
VAQVEVLPLFDPLSIYLKKGAVALTLLTECPPEIIPVSLVAEVFV